MSVVQITDRIEQHQLDLFSRGFGGKSILVYKIQKPLDRRRIYNTHPCCAAQELISGLVQLEERSNNTARVRDHGSREWGRKMPGDLDLGSNM